MWVVGYGCFSRNLLLAPVASMYTVVRNKAFYIAMKYRGPLIRGRRR